MTTNQEKFVCVDLTLSHIKEAMYLHMFIKDHRTIPILTQALLLVQQEGN